jgi:putative inorganic carbon (HCO3(-)) transporter
MRDIFLTGFFFAVLTQVFKRPYIGILLMAWVGYMSPHRLTWGFTYSMPFAMMATVVTLFVAILFICSKNMKKSYGKSLFPWTFSTYVLVFFIFWVCMTTITAENPSHAAESLEKFIKVQVGIFLTLLLINTKERLIMLVAVITFSIGFYGIKGGVFAIATGGSYRVWGPEGSFVEGNNEIALALIVVLPFIYFFFTYMKQKWVKNVLILCALLMLASIISSYSRGAFLALIGMGGFLWLHSKNKIGIGLVVFILVIAALPLMPAEWFERMDTIKTYDEDASAQGRINAWHMAFNLAKDRIMGGGYDVWGYRVFLQYAPDPTDVKDAHSIYFEVLGEHGFIGLFLFLLFYFSIWFKASSVIKSAKKCDDSEWIVVLAQMSKVSLVGYALGGAFLGLAFFDLPYHVASIILLLSSIVNNLPEKKNDNLSGTAFSSLSNKN